MFEPHEAQIKAWLEAEPAIPAATVLQRLMALIRRASDEEPEDGAKGREGLAG